jgi:outer membrane receptor protein involved in Fe transport
LIKVVSILLVVISYISFPQGSRPGGQITGRVLDSKTSQPIEYANIVVFSQQDSSQITGSVSSTDGSFVIEGVRPGLLYVDILFMGYERNRISGVNINRDNPEAALGDIKLEPSSINLDDVVIEGERPVMTYQIDKKVINVDQLGSTTATNAAEVLENIPSVTVDIEGNVSLRGSTNFTVLIDGRPSIVNAQDLLQQIPATTIESIELITNPSAKYDPEGTAGIINIKLKKSRSIGISGIVNASVGLNDKYGGDALFEYKDEYISTNAGFDYNNRNFPGTEESLNRYYYEGNTTTLSSSGDSRRGRQSFGLRGGLDFNLGDNDVLTLGARYNDREMDRNAVLYYEETNSLGTNYFVNNSNTVRSGNSFSINLGYVNRFNTTGHELSADLVFSRQKSDELTINEDITDNTITAGRKTSEQGPSKEYNGRLDYILPFSESSKLEAGYQGEIDLADELTGFQEYNPLTGIYEAFPEYDQDIRFEESEHSLYSTYSGNYNEFGYQLGLRGEYTLRNIILHTTGEAFNIDRWDYFPSVHTSYTFSPGNQIMASYTGRINRPGGWALEPFITWVDANNVRQGNPELLPELIDSYELGGQTYIGKVSANAELYYLFTKNKIEGVRSVYAEDVTMQTFANVGEDYSLGTEVMLNFGVSDFWNVSLMGNLYDYRIEGTIDGEPFSRSSFNWRGRVNNIFKLGKATQLQFNVMYNSPSVSSQGTREEFISSELSIRQDFFERKLSLILQVRDLFGSIPFEFTSEGPGFYSYSSMHREAPIVMLSVRLNINSFKQERTRDRNDEGFMEGEEL